MSFLTGSVATADVQADGETRLMSWSHAKLEMLESLDKEMYLRVHKALSRDVTRKALEAKLPDSPA